RGLLIDHDHVGRDAGRQRQGQRREPQPRTSVSHHQPHGSTRARSPPPALATGTSLLSGAGALSASGRNTGASEGATYFCRMGPSGTALISSMRTSCARPPSSTLVSTAPSCRWKRTNFG